MKHIAECMIESGVEPEVPSMESKIPFGNHVIEVWYDENASSPLAWNAFIYGFGTRNGFSREEAISAAKNYLR